MLVSTKKFFGVQGSTSNVLLPLKCLIGIKTAAAQTTNSSRIKPHLLFCLSPEAAIAHPGLIQAWLTHQSCYYGWTLPTVRCLVWAICRQVAALIQLTVAQTLKPASNLTLVLMRPVMTKRALSLFWTRNPRTTTPTTTRCRATTPGSGERGRFNPKPPLASRRGDKETSRMGGAKPVTLGGSRHLGTETLFDSSQTCSC